VDSAVDTMSRTNQESKTFIGGEIKTTDNEVSSIFMNLMEKKNFEMMMVEK